jgi:hypothetical protein
VLPTVTASTSIFCESPPHGVGARMLAVSCRMPRLVGPSWISPDTTTTARARYPDLGAGYSFDCTVPKMSFVPLVRFDEIAPEPTGHSLPHLGRQVAQGEGLIVSGLSRVELRVPGGRGCHQRITQR